MLIKYTYVDAVTGVSMASEPATHGPEMPNIPGLTLQFSNESQWPCPLPFFYGECDEVDPSTQGILEVLSEVFI